jgi:hypothetical protein
MLDLAGCPVAEGDFIIYATKTESPSLQFGWVEQISTKETTEHNHRHGTDYTSFKYKVKVRHADINGVKRFKTVFDYDPIAGTGEYKETDTPSAAWLTEHGHSEYEGGPDISKTDRLMVTQPI